MSPQSWRLTFRFGEELELSSPLQNFDACPCRFCWCGKCGPVSTQVSIFRSFLSAEAWSSLVKTTTLLDEDPLSIEDFRPAIQLAAEDAVLNDETGTSMSLSEVRSHHHGLQVQETSSQYHVESPIEKTSEYLKWISPSRSNIQMAIELPTTPVNLVDRHDSTISLQTTSSAAGSSKNQETVLEVLYATTDDDFLRNSDAVGAEDPLTPLVFSKQVSEEAMHVSADRDSASSESIDSTSIEADRRRNDEVQRRLEPEELMDAGQSCRSIIEATSEQEALVQSASIGLGSTTTDENLALLGISSATERNFNSEPVHVGNGNMSTSSSEDELTIDGFVFISSKSFPPEAPKAKSKLHCQTSSKAMQVEAPTVAEQRPSDAPSTSQSGQGRPEEAVDPTEEDLMLSDSDDNETGTDSDTSWTSSMSNDNRDSTDLGTSDFSETEDDSLPPSPSGSFVEPVRTSHAPVSPPPKKKSRWSTNGQHVRVCVECYQVFHGQEAFHRHLKSHDAIQPYKCPLCQLRFKEAKDQYQHLKIHKDGCSKYKCLQCDFRFSRINYLVAHMGSHAQGKTYECGICKKAFRGLVSFIQHQHSHNNADSDKKYTCGECSKHFANLTSLNNHQRIHTKKSCIEPRARLLQKKPYKCDSCSMSFTRSASLRRHKRCHLSKTVFECPECSMIFPRLSDLKRHKTMIHGEKSFKCDKCSWTFTTSSSLIRHEIRRHGREKVRKSKISVSPTQK